MNHRSASYFAASKNRTLLFPEKSATLSSDESLLTVGTQSSGWEHAPSNQRRAVASPHWVCVVLHLRRPNRSQQPASWTVGVTQM